MGNKRHTDPCCIVNIADQLPDLFTDEQMDQFIDDIISGKVAPEKLPVDFYQKIANRLTQGVYAGYGQDLAAELIREPDLIMLNYLRENVHVFSGAKTFQQVQEIQQLFIDDMGERVPLAEFRKKARNVFQEYNKNWLDTEYISAVANARSASKWVDIQELKGILPNLRFQTVGDQRVRQAHRLLNNVVLPVDHPFWDDHMTPLDWRCRCDVIQEDEDVPVTPMNQIDIPDVPDIFKFNAGKDRIVFSPAHPYFQVEKNFKPLAHQNFNLPLPEFVPPKPKPIAIGLHPMQPENYEEVLGKESNLPNEFWDLFEKRPKLKEVRTGSFFHPGEGSVNLNTERHSTPWAKKRIAAHEFGQALHFQRKLINMDLVDPRIEALFKESRKAIEYKRGYDFSSPMIKRLREVTVNPEALEDSFVEKYPQFTRFEIRTQLAGYADSVMALTDSEFGWGHTKDYMNQGGRHKPMRRMEWFAGCMEVRYTDNVVLRDLHPELYQAMKAAGDAIIKLLQ